MAQLVIFVMKRQINEQVVYITGMYDVREKESLL